MINCELATQERTLKHIVENLEQVIDRLGLEKRLSVIVECVPDLDSRVVAGPNLKELTVCVYVFPVFQPYDPGNITVTMDLFQHCFFLKAAVGTTIRLLHDECIFFATVDTEDHSASTPRFANEKKVPSVSLAPEDDAPGRPTAGGVGFIPAHRIVVQEVIV